jgi:hypothetical protein
LPAIVDGMEQVHPTSGDPQLRFARAREARLLTGRDQATAFSFSSPMNFA